MDIANSIYILKNQNRSLSLRNLTTGASASFTRNRKSTWSMASSVNMLFSCILYLAVCTVCLAADDDKCQSFAGGSVFPQETRRTSGHAIQWSQAVSKFSSTCIKIAFCTFWNPDYMDYGFCKMARLSVNDIKQS